MDKFRLRWIEWHPDISACGSSTPRGFASAKMFSLADFASSFGSQSWLASWKAVAFDATPSVDHTGSSALDRCLS